MPTIKSSKTLLTYTTHCAAWINSIQVVKTSVSQDINTEELWVLCNTAVVLNTTNYLQCLWLQIVKFLLEQDPVSSWPVNSY